MKLPQEHRQRLLLLGAPRSGTTLLADMIGSHPQIAIMAENPYGNEHRIVAKPIIGNKLCVPNQIRMSSSFLGRAKNALRSIPSLRSVLRPQLCIDDYLAEGAKIIAIIRDGNAVVSSIKKRGKRSTSTALARWSEAVEIILSITTSHPDRIVVVSYEKLVNDPAASMRAVCQFLDVPFDESMTTARGYADFKGIDPSRAAQAERTVDLPSMVPEGVAAYQSLVESAAVG